MTRRVNLPTEAEIRSAVAELAAAEPTVSPTVVAMARSLGLANATFWRHFPHIAQEIADARRRSLRSYQCADEPPHSSTDVKAETARLRSEKARLRAQLEIAAAHIQHLTLELRALREENLALREALELAQNVAQIPRR